MTCVRCCCVNSSGRHCVRLVADGQVFAWGHNAYSQLGNGNANQGLSPLLVTASPQNKKVRQVACGSHHSMALTLDGEVSCGFPHQSLMLFFSLFAP